VRLGAKQARSRAGRAERSAYVAPRRRYRPGLFARRPATTRSAASDTIPALFQVPTALPAQPGEITTANGATGPS
jgi:hypothetical protein